MSYQKNLYFGSVQSVCERIEKALLLHDKMKKDCTAMAKIHYKILKSWLMGKICLFIVVQKFSPRKQMSVLLLAFFPHGKIVYTERVTHSACTPLAHYAICIFFA
jgi:hypothetical protein